MTDDPIRLCRVLGSTMYGDRANKMSAVVRMYETLRHIDRIDYWFLSDGGMSAFCEHLSPLIEQCKHNVLSLQVLPPSSSQGPVFIIQKKLGSVLAERGIP